jgi:glycosyltransferase involved in cell wall biosynthesis
VDALAQALDKVMLNEELRAQFHAESLKEVEKFSVKSIVDSWEKVFASL